jgi:thiamine-monophosphate kinase
VNEFTIIEKYIRPIQTSSILMGQGDDCSVMALSPELYQVETTDCLVEDIHFRWAFMNAFELAQKSLLVNVSDVAAMGAIPKSAHLSLALPQNFSEQKLSDFFQGFYSLADQLGLPLVGGDLCRSPGPVFINIHLRGEVEKSQIKWRKGLKQKGLLCVTGPLGNSAAGLYALENALAGPEAQLLIEAHKKPPLEIHKARWLSEQSSVKGMMDLSDGLHSDLQRISDLKASIHLEQLPLSPEIQTFARSQNKDPLQWALCGGEDYRLLFLCAAGSLEQIQSEYKKNFGESFYVVGESHKSAEPGIRYFKNKSPFAVQWDSFQHF